MQLFLQCSTQWRRAGLTGVATGLDYTAVESVMRMTGMKNRKDTLWRLQRIESGALDAMNEQRDSK